MAYVTGVCSSANKIEFDPLVYNGDEKLLSVRLLTSNDYLRLRTYIEAAHRGLDREGCDIWAYRCPQTTESLIDFKSLLTWREVLKWLTVKMVAKRY
ncbi:unnamed protein product [Allacma fusca]|uniref:Uncharacterized protein n=1 Tax=Allacma fusca TaxID=39272 RepID=A0A8J2KHX3_9HEXA|nr:unnamed protein product [Allacma fusca]